MDRRTFLWLGSAAATGLAFPRLPRAARTATLPRTAVVRMWSDPTGARVGFDAVGLAVPPGATVRWVLDSGVHSTTAYHVDLHGRSVRIPTGAEGWDSGILTRPGATFEVTLAVPGVYDYYCLPHEAAGMVGRIVVGRPDEEFEIPAWAALDSPPDDSIPPAARNAFPPIDRIVRDGRVPNPGTPDLSKGGPR